MLRRVPLLALLLVAGLAPAACAHPLAPALLELRELGAGRVAVTWKTSVYRATGSDAQPLLPADCRAVGAPASVADADSLVVTWEVHCAHELVGQRIAIGGLGPAGIDALVRVTLADGRVVRGVVRAAAPAFVVPPREEGLAIVRAYFRFGVAHILTGVDHLLFLAALLLLVRGRRRRIETIAAFAVGHSITLTLVTLELLRAPTRPIELAIALSLFVLAVELTRDAAAPSLLRRKPWIMALAFGLLHGCGFAGALREIGLPAGDVPLALLSFNVGIEVGELTVIAALLIGAAGMSRVPVAWPRWTPQIPVYVIGTLAAYWCFERAFAFLG
ncbi:MAG: HupE/UreJ family protein [bacterium]